MEAAATSALAAAKRSALVKPVASGGRDSTTHHQHLAELLEAVGKERDRGAFAQLFRRLAPVVTRLLIERGVRPTLAEELLQETMLVVWRHAATFDRRRGSASTWVSAIARNKHLDLIRAGKRSAGAAYEPWLHGLPDSEPAVEEVLGARQCGHVLRDAINTLPPEQGEVLRMAFYEERSHREIAAEQELPLGTVKSRIRLALAHLRTSAPVAHLR